MRYCRSCGGSITPREVHECNKRNYETCKQNKETVHLCYMQPLKNVFPPGDKVLYVFYNFETTLNTRYSDIATVHVPNVVCMQQVCSRYESSEDVQQDCVQYGKRKHTFREEPVDDMLAYLCEPRGGSNRLLQLHTSPKHSICISS